MLIRIRAWLSRVTRREHPADIADQIVRDFAYRSTLASEQGELHEARHLLQRAWGAKAVAEALRAPRPAPP